MRSLNVVAVCSERYIEPDWMYFGQIYNLMVRPVVIHLDALDAVIRYSYDVVIAQYSEPEKLPEHFDKKLSDLVFSQNLSEILEFINETRNVVIKGKGENRLFDISGQQLVYIVARINPSVTRVIIMPRAVAADTSTTADVQLTEGVFNHSDLLFEIQQARATKRRAGVLDY